LYLAVVDSSAVALVSGILFLAASLMPWGTAGTDLWSFEIGMVGGVSALALVVWRIATFVRPFASERLVSLRCAILGTVAVIAAAYQLLLILFSAEPPRLVYRGAVSWGEWVMLGATAVLAVATSHCWAEHLREWPPTGFRRRVPALLGAGASAAAYVVLCLTANWFTVCNATAPNVSGPSSLKGLQGLFNNFCVSESYRASALGELTSFLSIVLLASVVVATMGLQPIDGLAHSVTAALSIGVGLLAAFVVIEALRTRSTLTEHVQLGGWLTLLVALPLLASGLSLLRER
jgi:hypothetical protein